MSIDATAEKCKKVFMTVMYVTMIGFATVPVIGLIYGVLILLLGDSITGVFLIVVFSALIVMFFLFLFRVESQSSRN